MLTKRFILGIDIGTTATKVALFDMKGITVSSVTEQYDLDTPTRLQVEVDIENLWMHFKKALRTILSSSGIKPADIKTLGISAQGETLTLTDPSGKPLRKAIVWLDNRAQEEAQILSNEFSREKSYKVTGQVELVPTWPASKILWLRRHEPETFKQASRYMLVEDYFLWKMTGKFVSEGSLLCSTCYWNILTKKWWNEMIEFLGINEEQLPEIREPGENIGNLLPSAAADLGLSTTTVACTGGLDQACGTIGVGNIKPGIFTENIGAALAICATLNELVFDKKTRVPIHYHAIPDTYMAHTFTTGGMVLRWFRDTFYITNIPQQKTKLTASYELIDSEVKKIRPGSEGLVALPHLQGAMAPDTNPKATGVFFGFTLRHTKPHFARSLMEAVACTIRRNIDALEDLNIRVTEIRALGGGARSDVWNQIVADLTKRPVMTTSHDEDAACLGAAILAGKATGLYKNLKEAIEETVTITRTFEPNAKNFEVYDDLYSKHGRLYENLRGLFT